MTKEEAIKLIEHIGIAFVPTDQYEDYADPEPYEEAIDMAIEALQNLSKPNNGLQGSDLISRTDAIDAVCEDCEWERKCHEECQHIETLKSLPSAEAVEIVRCKECRYYECCGLPCPLDVCESLGDDGFCSRGERKGGDDE